MLRKTHWANRIAQTTRVNPRLSAVKVKGNTVVLIEVAENAVKPVPCRGRYFKRVDRSNRRMRDGDLTRVILDKVGSTWDEIADPRVEFDDLDPSRLDWFRRTCNEKGRRPIPEQKVTARTLEKLGLMKAGASSRAAALLFAREPQRWFPSAMLKVGRFRSETLIVDDREIGGTVFDQVDAAMGYFRERLQTRFEFHGTPARDVIWDKASLPAGFPKQDRLRQLVTLRLTQLLKYQTWRLSLFSFWSPTDEDFYLIPEAAWRVTDELTVSAALRNSPVSSGPDSPPSMVQPIQHGARLIAA